MTALCDPLPASPALPLCEGENTHLMLLDLMSPLWEDNTELVFPALLSPLRRGTAAARRASPIGRSLEEGGRGSLTPIFSSPACRGARCKSCRFPDTLKVCPSVSLLTLMSS